MIAIYLNRYNDTSITYFDLSFEEEDVQMLRLGGVTFEEGFSEQDMIDRATEIFEGNFTDLTLTEIIIN
jgi:hypothetical protein|tara:strand:+ start:582 stop:788 length:207 start_codon:yes stop_codon:yes gene_type:complete